MTASVHTTPASANWSKETGGNANGPPALLGRGLPSCHDHRMAKRPRWLRWIAWGATALAALLLIVPFLLPLPELDTVPPRELADPEDRFVVLNGIEVRYREAGSGEPVYLLLHGFGASARSWDRVLEGLASQGRVVAFDRVGFGLTERPLEWEGDSPYASSAQVDLAISLLDMLGISEAIVIGHSAGAEIGAALALDHSDRVAGLVLESPALDSGPGEPARLLLATPQGQRVVRFLAHRAGDRVDRLLQSAYHDPTRLTEETLDGYRQPFGADSWDIGLAHFTAAPRLDSLRDRLTQLSQPLLIVTGREDTWVSTNESVELAAGLPESELVVIPDCGHVSHEECPGSFLQAVSGWVVNRSVGD